MLSKKKKPVTILTGYLGSGKTTVLNELLKNEASEKIAVIVNDMGSVNIDASLIRNAVSVNESDLGVVEMSNGCICCTLQQAFMEQINTIAGQENVERILVEASGISDPSSIAAGFLEYERLGLCDKAYLDSVVCVVDADRIYAEFLEDLTHPDREQTDQDPDIINLVMDQIEFCNIILLNKCDLLRSEEVEQVRKTIRTFQKEAKVIECIQGKVNPERIFHNTRFDYEKVLHSSRIQEQFACGKREELHDEHGITSFLFEDKRPFDYKKFMEFLENDYPGEVIRAKGYIWFADDDMHVQLFEQAGRNASVTEVSNWLAAFPEDEQKRTKREYPEIEESWDERYGDRINQIVFIGKDFDPQQVEERLRVCLVSE